MNIRSWIVIIIFLVWGVLCWNWYTCVIKGFCAFKKTETLDLSTIALPPAFIFYKSSIECLKGKGFTRYRDSLKQFINDGKTIIITGLYDIDEINKSTFSNLGLARAHSIKSFMASDMDTLKIRISSRPFDLDLQKGSFEAYETTIEIAGDYEKNEPGQITHEAESSKNETKDELTSADTNKFLLKENVATIFFAPNAVYNLPNKGTDTYLTNLAEQLKANGKTIFITGYTDKNEKMNLRRIRAWVIKRELLNKGVKSEQLITRAKSNTNPLANKNTSDETNKNRRVVITFIKN